MSILVTGSAGLVGYEISKYFLDIGEVVVGIDNDMRGKFFGASGSNANKINLLKKNKNYIHINQDIRDLDFEKKVFNKYPDIETVVHTAAQPSHDWARDNKLLDFDINARSTLRLLESTYSKKEDTKFIFISTNKVYGDTPNHFKYKEINKRFEIEEPEKYKLGFDTSLSIDNNLHSFFGVSKVSADLLVQEFGKNYGYQTVALRGGCLTGENHTGVKAHGFLNYLSLCFQNNIEYTIEGYGGFQVRDNLHSLDVVGLIEAFRDNPSCGEAFNIGGGRKNSISVLEAVDKFSEIYKKNIVVNFNNNPRLGDHMWWITDLRPLEKRFPGWKVNYDLDYILENMAY